MIVLLSDGENNQQPDPLAAAQAAADRGVRIYTVGIGSAAGTTLEIDGFKVHSQLDEATLRQIADMTGGTYYAAPTTPQLQRDLRHASTPASSIKPEAMEVTSLFAGAGVLILLRRRRRVARLARAAAVMPSFLWPLAPWPSSCCCRSSSAARIWMLRRRRSGAALLEPVAGARRAARARRASAATCRSRCSSSRWPAWSSPSPGRSPSSACPPARRRSSSRSTSRGACAPPTSTRAASQAAEAAAASFIQRQGSTTQIGIVAFAGFAEIVQAPTTDQRGPARRRRAA